MAPIELSCTTLPVHLFRRPMAPVTPSKPDRKRYHPKSICTSSNPPLTKWFPPAPSPLEGPYPPPTETNMRTAKLSYSLAWPARGHAHKASAAPTMRRPSGRRCRILLAVSRPSPTSIWIPVTTPTRANGIAGAYSVARTPPAPLGSERPTVGIAGSFGIARADRMARSGLRIELKIVFTVSAPGYAWPAIATSPPARRSEERSTRGLVIQGQNDLQHLWGITGRFGTLTSAWIGSSLPLDAMTK